MPLEDNKRRVIQIASDYFGDPNRNTATQETAAREEK
jgi:hypothetical protein